MAKRIMVFLLAVFVLMGMSAGCKKKNVGTPEDNAVVKEEEPVEEGELLGFSGITMENPYFITLEQSVRDAVEDSGNRLVTKDPGMNSVTQTAQIREMIEQGIKVLFLSPVDWEEISPVLDELNEADIKIINIDTQVKDIDKVDCFIGSDNHKAGYICGEKLTAAHPEGGRILILEAPSVNAVNDRITGFEEAISEKGFEVVSRADVKGDLNTALTVTKQLLSENKDITAIMCGNDQIALGALVAVQSSGLSGVRIYGIDGSPDLKKELSKSSTMIAGTCAQSPIRMGQDAVEAAVKMLADESYEEEIIEEVFFIDKDNVKMYGTDGWQ